MVFCHAEGAEKTLSVSTQEGNEASKSNELEQKEAVRIFLRFTKFSNNYRTSLVFISSSFTYEH